MSSGPDEQVDLTATLTLRTSEIQPVRKFVLLFILDKTPIFLATWEPGLIHVLHLILLSNRHPVQYQEPGLIHVLSRLLLSSQHPVQYWAPHQPPCLIHLPYILAMPPSIHIILLPLLSLTLMILLLMHTDIGVKPAL
jgi:hypothetical protein